MDKILSSALITADIYTRTAEPFKTLGFFIIMTIFIALVAVIVMFVATLIDNTEKVIEQKEPVHHIIKPEPQQSQMLTDLKNFSLNNSLSNEEDLDELHQYVEDDLKLRQRGEVRIGGRRKSH